MTPEPFRRLRLRLTLWYAGIFTLVLLAYTAGTYAYMRQSLVAGIDELNQAAVSTLVESLKRRDWVLSRRFLFESEVVGSLRPDLIIQLYDSTGRLVGSQQRVNVALPLQGPLRQTIAWPNLQLRVQRQPLLDDGTYLGMLIVAQPLTDVQRALTRLVWTMASAIPLTILAILVAGVAMARKAVQPVRQVLELQRRFIADASHELRTPLATLQAQTEVAIQDPSPDPGRLRETLEVVRRTAERMGRLVQQLLFLSRADTAMLADQRRRFFLDELLEELVTEFSPLAESKSLSLALQPPEGELPVLGDPDQVHQLLSILLDNAIKYCDPPAAIRVRAWRDKNYANVAVLDTGPGIPPEQLSRVFERFYRGDPSRDADKPGSGLGLAIARVIAEAHGGRLTVASSPGQGSEFLLALPLSAM